MEGRRAVGLRGADVRTDFKESFDGGPIALFGGVGDPVVAFCGAESGDGDKRSDGSEADRSGGTGHESTSDLTPFSD
jgi:hypothetical protein